MTSPDLFEELAKTLVEQVQGQEFAGLTGHAARVHSAFVADGKACVVWTLAASHGDQPLTGGPFPAETPFLGWYATGREVQIPVVSIANATDPGLSDATDWHHQWDRLGALAQIGVRAVGRPVLRTNSPLDPLPWR